LVLPNSFKSALVPFFAGIPERLGYLGEARRGLLTRRLPNPGKDTPMVERYEALGRLSGLAGPHSSPLPMPELRVDPQSIEAVAERFGLIRQDPVIVFCPGAEYGPAKRWPIEHFAKLADLTTKAHPRAQIVLAGAGGDIAACSSIVQKAHARIISTAGKTSVEEAIALLAGAALVVSNDSGLMHVAAALRRPLIALYGSTDPRHTPPQSADPVILWLKLECSPCFQRVCPLGHFRCLIDITPERVLAAIPSGTLH
jgi:heptosyltransferase-2